MVLTQVIFFFMQVTSCLSTALLWLVLSCKHSLHFHPSSTKHTLQYYCSSCECFPPTPAIFVFLVQFPDSYPATVVQVTLFSCSGCYCSLHTFKLLVICVCFIRLYFSTKLLLFTWLIHHNTFLLTDNPLLSIVASPYTELHLEGKIPLVVFPSVSV